MPPLHEYIDNITYKDIILYDALCRLIFFASSGSKGGGHADNHNHDRGSGCSCRDRGFDGDVHCGAQIMKQVLLLIAAVCCYSLPANAQNWRSRASYPAFVEQVVFRTGNRLATGLSLQWGAWSVTFGQSAPVARWEQMGDCSGPLIEGLACRNPVAGEKSCNMSIAITCPSARQLEDSCGLGIRDQAKPIIIKCPVQIVFGRR